jgi:hypothetical protein
VLSGAPALRGGEMENKRQKDERERSQIVILRNNNKIHTTHTYI